MYLIIRVDIYNIAFSSNSHREVTEQTLDTAFFCFLFQMQIDGVPLGELDIKWLREKVGFVGHVSQKTLGSDI